jgi:hypothetical protein
MKKITLIISTLTVISSLLMAAAPYDVGQSTGPDKPKTSVVTTKEVNKGEPSMEKIYMPPNYSFGQSQSNQGYQVACQKIGSIWYCWYDVSLAPDGEPWKCWVHWRYRY